MERGGTAFGFGMREAVRLVFIAVVGSQVEVSNDIHLLGEEFENVSLEQEIADGGHVIEVELGVEVVENVSAGRNVLAVLAEFRD